MDSKNLGSCSAFWWLQLNAQLEPQDTKYRIRGISVGCMRGRQSSKMCRQASSPRLSSPFGSLVVALHLVFESTLANRGLPACSVLRRQDHGGKQFPAPLGVRALGRWPMRIPAGGGTRSMDGSCQRRPSRLSGPVRPARMLQWRRPVPAGCRQGPTSWHRERSRGSRLGSRRPVSGHGREERTRTHRPT